MTDRTESLLGALFAWVMAGVWVLLVLYVAWSGAKHLWGPAQPVECKCSCPPPAETP